MAYANNKLCNKNDASLFGLIRIYLAGVAKTRAGPLLPIPCFHPPKQNGMKTELKKDNQQEPTHLVAVPKVSSKLVSGPHAPLRS